jgi:hypothetical protein
MVLYYSELWFSADRAAKALYYSELWYSADRAAKVLYYSELCYLADRSAKVLYYLNYDLQQAEQQRCSMILISVPE